MRSSIRRYAFFMCGAAAVACSANDQTPARPNTTTSSTSGTGGAAGDGTSGPGGSASSATVGSGGNTGSTTTGTGGNAGSGMPGRDASTEGGASCAYTDDASFCRCMGWNCGGTTMKDSGGSVHTVYCGTCSGGTYCQSTPSGDVGVGACGGQNPLAFAWQRQKINMLVSMGENDNTDVNYDYAENIHDGRGYTVGIVGFCTGTGDFIEVARCYEVLKPNNVLSKYWGHRDASGKAIDGLVYYEDQFLATGMNQGDTKLIDSLGPFVQDCATAAKDPEYRACQDTMAETFYMATALQHAAERGLRGAMTLGFLYDTELNFGDDDDSPSTPGTKTVLARADADYGPGMPSDFVGKPWEESKWLGYMIRERTIVMSKDSTWNSDMDQNATWEAARRLHTAKTSTPESGTDLGMDYDFISRYKAGSAVAGTPCWPTGLASTLDSQSSIYRVFTDKSASATDQTKWQAASDSGGDTYAACPANPTP